MIFSWMAIHNISLTLLLIPKVVAVQIKRKNLLALYIHYVEGMSDTFQT
jgi:hypothetical protein